MLATDDSSTNASDDLTPSIEKSSRCLSEASTPVLISVALGISAILWIAIIGVIL